MQRRSKVFLQAGLLLAWCLLLRASASAQLVGVRDLTSGWRVPSEHISVPQTCNDSNSSIDADPTSQSPGNAQATKSLELAIVTISPARLEIGGDFTATLRLKNIGTQPVLVPSVADGEQLASASADATEEKYEVGDVSFRLLSGKSRRIPTFLSSRGALFANPDDHRSYLSLEPGSWLELKLKGTVECGVEECLGEIQPDNKAVLTAWWYQRVLTHRVNGCNEAHGSSTIREVDSAPLEVVVQNPPAKRSGTVPKK